MDTNYTELKPLHMHVECMEAWLFANEWTLFSDWSILLPIILTLCLDPLTPGLSIKRRTSNSRCKAWDWARRCCCEAEDKTHISR